MTGLKVMIVDDTAFMRMILRNIFEDLNHLVVAEASNGEEAIQKYRQFRPDLVTMDITMPNMDGIRAVKNIKAMDATAKIIICSAMGHRDMILEAIRNGASDLLLKPINKERVVEAINKAFTLQNSI